MPDAGKRPRKRFTVDDLFTDGRPLADGVAELVIAKEIRLDRIEPDPDQPRRTFDEARLDELAASIRIEGVLQPIVVRYDDARDRYVVVHGERRWRASAMAGLEAIPALVRDVPEERRLIQQLMENIVRDDLNAVDRATALRTLKQQLGDAPWETVAAAVGIKRSRLFQLLDTGKLPEPIQDDIRSGRLSEKQSRALQNLAPAAQVALRDAILDDGLGADDTQRIARVLRALPADVDDVTARAAVDAARHQTAEATGATADGAITGGSPARIPAPATAAALLDAVAALRSDDPAAARSRLAALADAEVSPTAHRRLTRDVAALSASLARFPGARRSDRAAAQPLLRALRDALDALIEPAN